ncbi:MAG: hypothetical protein COX57_02850 [Alphaproteobacteria bacterium CG_4_10_14_0_2_um_filter_63_37]|nr:MAG: hypothetical protein AUJ55_03320 [Proteobacteria bacterium CG1_02_64_396]PJA25483.1 MAG: hypothetical protein COX57_02850 [Alphaproteobacteria bacterium CG_4_10_14_0_2_um_filter_63_37]
MPGPINNTLTTQIEPLEPVVTYIGIPIVTVNFAFSITHIPTNFQVIIGPGLGGNMLDVGTVGLGDQMGLGVASGINTGPDVSIFGSTCLMIGPGPTRSTCDPCLQDLSDGVGMSLIPGQFSAMVLR